MSDEPEALVVPYQDIDADTLRKVIEAFVLREGTDYGSAEYSLEQKVAQVMRQLTNGEAQITYDSATETVDIISKRR